MGTSPAIFSEIGGYTLFWANVFGAVLGKNVTLPVILWLWGKFPFSRNVPDSTQNRALLQISCIYLTFLPYLVSRTNLRVVYMTIETSMTLPPRGTIFAFFFATIARL